MIFKSVLEKMWLNAMDINKKNILDYLENNQKAIFLDMGCDDGIWTLELANKIDTKDINGIEIVDERIAIATEKGVKVSKANLNEKLPYDDNTFDVIHANQVIEHIGSLDLFVSEINRVLKVGGYCVISTENGSSWCNIFASIMGWQIFSLTNVSAISSGIGNPLAIHKNDKVEFSSWTHKTIFNYRGLKEFFELYNFERVELKGAGYFPLPGALGKIDVRHSHFITLKAYKK